MAYFYPGPTSAGEQRAHSEIPSLPNDDLDLISAPAAGEQRAHAEIPSLPNDNLGLISAPAAGGGPSLLSNNNNTDEDLFSMFLDVDKLNSLCGGSLEAEGESSSAAAAASGGVGVTVGADELMGYAPWLGHQQHGQPMGMDEPMSSFMAEQQLVGAAAAAPRMMERMQSQETISWPADLVALALVDPVKAKKILANRQSAAKSKERKMRYIAELERSVQSLESEATKLSVRLAVLQRDGTLLTTEHSELKIRLQAMDQHVRLQDGLSNILQEEIQRLKVVTGEVDNNGGGGMMMDIDAMPCPFGGDHEMFPNNEEIQSMMATQQLQQLQPSLPASAAATGPSEPVEATAPAAGTTAAGGGEGPQDEWVSDSLMKD